MRYTVNKVFWAWGFEDEEQWLNSMSAKGMQLVSTGFCKYVFEDGQPGEYSYRLELLEQWPTHPESIAYIRFLEETGVEHIASYMRWVYLRRKSNMGEFDLFSDNDSRIRHLKRILTILFCLLPLEIGSLLSNISVALKGSFINQICVVILVALLGFILVNIMKLYGKIRKMKKERIMCE